MDCDSNSAVGGLLASGDRSYLGAESKAKLKIMYVEFSFTDTAFDFYVDDLSFY
jgi:hypothetical protein